MDFDELNGFEKIGLAFMCGFAAARSFEEGKDEVMKDKNTHISVEKIEGKEANELIKILDKLNFKEEK